MINPIFAEYLIQDCLDICFYKTAPMFISRYAEILKTLLPQCMFDDYSAAIFKALLTQYCNSINITLSQNKKRVIIKDNDLNILRSSMCFKIDTVHLNPCHYIVYELINYLYLIQVDLLNIKIEWGMMKLNFRHYENKIDQTKKQLAAMKPNLLLVK